MSLVTDTATITSDLFAKATIPYVAVGEMLYNRGEEARAKDILNFGYSQVKEMYNYYNNKSFERVSGVQYGMQK